MFGGKTWKSETNFIKETIRCPFTGKFLPVTESMFVRYMECYPDFVGRMLHHYNEGIIDNALILRLSILDYFEKHVEFKNEYFFYIMSKYLICFYRCDFGFTSDYPVICNSLGQFGLLKTLTYAKSPPAFREFLSELRAMSMLPNGQIDLSVIAAHNCSIILNRLDQHINGYTQLNTTSMGDDDINLYPDFSTFALLKWLIINLKILIYEGKLIINHEQTNQNLAVSSTFRSDRLEQYYTKEGCADLDKLLFAAEEKLEIVPEVNWEVVNANPDADEDDIIVKFKWKKREYHARKKHPVNLRYPRTTTDDYNDKKYGKK